MSLSAEKEATISEFEELITDMRTREENADHEYAERFFNLIEKWLGKADIKYTSGLLAPNGAVTGTFVGKLE